MHKHLLYRANQKNYCSKNPADVYPPTLFSGWELHLHANRADVCAFSARLEPVEPPSYQEAEATARPIKDIYESILLSLQSIPL